MTPVQLDDQVFQAAQRRAVDGGYPSVEAYITHVVSHDLMGEREETSNFDHLFTPQIVAELKEVSENARSVGKTYTMADVRSHFRQKSDEWAQRQSE